MNSSILPPTVAGHPSTEQVVRTALSAYAAQDFETFLAQLADDVVYTLWLDETVLPFAGEARGKSEFGGRLALMHRAFDYVLWRPLSVNIQGEIATNQIEFMLKHRATGEMVTGRCRFVTRVVDGRVVQVDEHHDRERIQAFMRLVGGVE